MEINYIIHVDRMSSEHGFRIMIVSSCNGCQPHQVSTSDKESVENYGKKDCNNEKHRRRSFERSK